jgi:hypothetical protein
MALVCYSGTLAAAIAALAIERSATRLFPAPAIAVPAVEQR